MGKWWLCLVLKLPTHLRCGSGSNPMRGCAQLLMEGCWFTPTNTEFLQLWNLTAIYNLKKGLKNGIKHQFPSPHTLIFRYVNQLYLDKIQKYISNFIISRTKMVTVIFISWSWLSWWGWRYTMIQTNKRISKIPISQSFYQRQGRYSGFK